MKVLVAPTALIVLLCLIFCYSPACREDTTELAEAEFSQYRTGKYDVIVSRGGKDHFDGHYLQKSGTLYYNHRVYYIKGYSNGMIIDPYRDIFLEIFSCNVYGEEETLVFSKTIENARSIGDREKNGAYYFWYKTADGMEHIDRYVVSTGVYESIIVGENVPYVEDYVKQNVPDEISPYKIEVIKDRTIEHGKIIVTGKVIVTDILTGEERIIDDTDVEKAECFESMVKFGYDIKKGTVSKGHILLDYWIDAGGAWNRAHLILEYNFLTDSLEYKMFAITEDEPYSIHYVG